MSEKEKDILNALRDKLLQTKRVKPNKKTNKYYNHSMIYVSL